MTKNDDFSLVEPRRSAAPAKAGIHFQQAFSLVELSIVFVILGLLVGGILVGQSLIRAAELRSVLTDVEKYTTATKAFKTKYESLPGDMPDATAFWGKDNTNCPTHSGTAATPGTCNGNGDGIMNDATVASGTGEIFQYWKQLTLTGLIEGSYSGIAGTADPSQDLKGVNVPSARLKNAGWKTANAANWPGTAGGYALDYGNYLAIGAPLAGGQMLGATLTPQEAWDIDTKLDDGRPAYGFIIARYWNNACSAADDGTSANNDLNASYRLTDSSLQCALYFIKRF
ncbi:MAG: type II secretion system protein [Alphaproteobacteria bacterium]